MLSFGRLEVYRKKTTGEGDQKDRQLENKNGECNNSSKQTIPETKVDSFHGMKGTKKWKQGIVSASIGYSILRNGNVGRAEVHKKNNEGGK